MINKLIVAITALVAASAASASSHPSLTDAQYLSAARCEGLMSSASLGKVNTSTIDALLAKAGASRTTDVTDRADQVRDDARREAAHAGPQGRSSLIAERDSCMAAHQASMAAN